MSDSTTWVEMTSSLETPVKVYQSTDADPAIKVVIPVLATPLVGVSEWVMRQLVNAGIPFRRDPLTGQILKSLERGKLTLVNSGNDTFVATWTP